MKSKNCQLTTTATKSFSDVPEAKFMVDPKSSFSSEREKALAKLREHADEFDGDGKSQFDWGFLPFSICTSIGIVIGYSISLLF